MFLRHHKDKHNLENVLMGVDLSIKDAPNFQPKMAQKRIFGFRPKYFYHRNNTAETEICDDANKKRGQHTLVWISANMSAVWTFFNVSEKDPRIAICKNCNALILMKLVHSHSHKCNGTRVAAVWTFSHRVIHSCQHRYYRV